LSKYRNRVEIIADILNVVGDGALKTQIMYKGNLSYKLLTRYLREVIGAGLVCAVERANIYQLTEKGKMFLRDFKDYSLNRAEAEQHTTAMNGLKTKLEGMCTQKAVRKGLTPDPDKKYQAI
jgi:predicted transcriptional regulator